MEPSQQTSVYLVKYDKPDCAYVAIYALSAVRTTDHSSTPQPALNLTRTVQDTGARYRHVRPHRHRLDALPRLCGATRRPCRYLSIDSCETAGKTKSPVRLRC
jgi:hypothetical protein